MASVVIHRYIKVGGSGAGKAKAHIRYIQHRRGEDKERSAEDPAGPKRRELFDDERDSIDRRELNKLIDREAPGGVALHKLTLSPGVQGVDLKEYTREVMDELGKAKGLELQWAAAPHKNTDHDHVHVVILGTDKQGSRVRLDRSDHGLLREKGDRFLEREHVYDRELERERAEFDRQYREQNPTREREEIQERIGSLFGRGQTFEPSRDNRTIEPEREKPINLMMGDVGAGQSDSYYKTDDLDKLKELARDYEGGDSYVRSMGEQEYERLKGWIEDREPKQEIEKKQDGWSKEKAIEALPEREKITVKEKTYTKYDSSEDLKGLNEHIKTHYEDRLDKQQYAQLQRWIETKERDGEDCFEKWDKNKDRKEKEREGKEAHREWHEFDKRARKAYDDRNGAIHRRMPKQQRIFEERGRNSEYHAIYMNTMAKQKLIEARERTNDPTVLKYIEKELEHLKEHGQELARELPTIDLDKLYGKDAERGRNNKTREPDKPLNLDNIKFPDVLEEAADSILEILETNDKDIEVDNTADKVDDKDRDQEYTERKSQEPERETGPAVPENEQERASDEPTSQQQQQQQQEQARLAQEQARQLGEKAGQDIHEQKTVKPKLDDREDAERDHEERER